MKNKYRIASIVLTILFISSIALTFQFVYSFQGNVAKYISIQDVNELHKLRPMMFRLGVNSFIQVILGLLAIFSMLLSSRNIKQYEIVYVEKKAEKTKAEQEYETQMEENEKLALALAEADNKISRISQLSTEAFNSADLAEKLLQAFCNEFNAVQGALFFTQHTDNKKILKMAASYAYFNNGESTRTYEFGEGLIGQVAKEAKMLYITAIPDGYITVLSGLGNAAPGHLLICPIVLNGAVLGIIEVASFSAITKAEEKLTSGFSDILSNLISTKKISSAVTEA